MALRSFLTQSISYKNPSSTQDAHGKFGLGAAVNTKARFERTYKLIITPEREKEPIHGMFIVSPADVIYIGAQISYSGDLYRVIARSDAPGRSGSVHHYELMCQLWSYAA